MKFVEYPDSELMMFTLADILASELATQLRSKDRASLSVPGGTTPGPVSTCSRASASTGTG